ncbi:hypothetical protein B0H14DRAFT_3141965 [Mycena olivaceomarginata]|nr:hypothetical protein B0H14DRAFT_3141965 [Mycena olivaceomarginata]
MCLFPDVLATSLPLIPASRFTLRSLARSRPLLPRVSPAPVLYPINSLNSVLGCATGQCMLNYSHVIVEFMSQPGYDCLLWMEMDADVFPLESLRRRLLAIARREHMKRAGVKHFALAPMDMARDWLFSMRKLGLQPGFMPIDLHDSVGVRAALGVGPHSQCLERVVDGRRGRGDDRLHGCPVACQWLALRCHLSFPSLRKFTLRAEDDDSFGPMAEICAVLDRNAHTLRHLVLGAYLARHHSWDAVFQSSFFRTTRRHAHQRAGARARRTRGRAGEPDAARDVRGRQGRDRHLRGGPCPGRGRGRGATAHAAPAPALVPVSPARARRPAPAVRRRGDVPRAPAAAAPARSRELSVGARAEPAADAERAEGAGGADAHFNSAAAQGPRGALPRGVHALHLTTVVAERDLNEHVPALRAFPALAFLHLQSTATHRPKPNLVSEREFAQQTEGWVAAARGVARVLPGLDFLCAADGRAASSRWAARKWRGGRGGGGGGAEGAAVQAAFGLREGCGCGRGGRDVAGEEGCADRL